MEDLTKYVDELFPEEKEPQGFTIDTQQKAEWALDKIARAEGRIQRFRDAVTAAKARLDQRLEEVTKADLNTVERLGAMVRPWAEVEIAKIGNRKSVKLLGGTVGFRQSPARLEVTDPNAAIAWLEANQPASVRVKKEVDKVNVKELVMAGGEVPPGCELVAGDVRFYIEAQRPELEGGK